MTADDFAALARATGLSDARLGFTLGARGERANVAAQARKWKSGARPVPAHVASKLRALVKALDGRTLPDTDEAVEAALAEPAWLPEWIIGVGEMSDADLAAELRENGDELEPEFVVHTRPPRFIARAAVDEVEPVLATFVYAFDDESELAVDWLDDPPDGPALDALMRRALDALG